MAWAGSLIHNETFQMVHQSIPFEQKSFHLCYRFFCRRNEIFRWL